MNVMNAGRFAALGLIVFMGGVLSQAAHASETDERLKETIDQLVEDGAMPGAVVLLARDGKVVAKSVAGSRDIADAKPMTEDTIFRLYSMSKPITSVAIMMLAEEGRLRLDQPAEDFLPEFANMRVYESGGLDDMVTVPVDRPITIHDLLTHTAGITYHFTGATPVHQYYRKYGVMRDTPVGRTPEDGPPARSLDELVARLGKAPMLHQPGERFSYSYSTTVLGAIVERISGQSLSVFLEERIFRPLGMTDTGFFVSDEDLNRFVTNYMMGEGGLQEIEAPETSDYRDRARLLDGGGALAGTARDYMRFALMLAGGGELDGTRILTPEGVAELFKTRVRAEAPGFSLNFGYGFQIGDDETARSGQLPNGAVGWSGSGNTFFWLWPESGEAVVFMTQVILPPQYSATGRQFRTLVNGIAVDALRP